MLYVTFLIMLIFLFNFRFKEHTQQLTWPEVHSLYHEGHENILGIIDLILTLPASSSANERGFSEMKLTKTSIRSKMSNATLNNSIAIQMSTPGVKLFDPEQAMNRWMTGGKRARRPVFNEGSSRNRARLEPSVNMYDQGAVEVVEDTADTSEPAAQQDMMLVEDDEEEEAEEVVFNEKQEEDVGDDDEGVFSEYESDAEMTEEMVLGKLDQLQYFFLLSYSVDKQHKKNKNSNC